MILGRAVVIALRAGVEAVTDLAPGAVPHAPLTRLVAVPNTTGSDNPNETQTQKLAERIIRNVEDRIPVKARPPRNASSRAGKVIFCKEEDSHILMEPHLFKG